MEIEPSRRCSNYGCTIRYCERELTPLCRFHDGVPVFHEGYKFWSCCKRKTVHFDKFLEQLGCEEGDHCWVPKESPVLTPRSNVVSQVCTDEVQTTEALRRQPLISANERPDVNSPLTLITITCHPNVTQKSLISTSGEVQELQHCQNTGCSMSASEATTNPECVFHSGEPIFHEGLKYWSCCKKKAMEFEEFLKQKGCTRGDHCWTKRSKAEYRFDWHQTVSHVLVTIYAKGISPGDLIIRANNIRLKVSMTMPDGIYEKDWILYGVVDEGESCATIYSTKLEIKLKKESPLQWTSFEHPEFNNLNQSQSAE